MAKGRAVAIVLDDVEKRELTALTRKHGAARIVLAAAGGLKNKEIASKLGMRVSHFVPVVQGALGRARHTYSQSRMNTITVDIASWTDH